jgi:putative pyruvate formate lyase activating enzyme
VETLKLLEGIFDIYMPDMKYSDEAVARRFSGIDQYPAVNRAAVSEMHRQVGDLQMDEQGVATRGLLVRHLVLPHGLAGTREVCLFLAERVSRNAYVNVMAQYRPCHRAFAFPELARAVTGEEFAEAVRTARECGLNRLDRVEARSFARIVMGL